MLHDNKATEAALTLAKTKQTKVSKIVNLAKIKHTTNGMYTSRQKYTLMGFVVSLETSVSSSTSSVSCEFLRQCKELKSTMLSIPNIYKSFTKKMIEQSNYCVFV